MRRKMKSGLRRVSYRRHGGASLRSERKVAEICMRMKEKLGKQSRYKERVGAGCWWVGSVRVLHLWYA